MPQDQQQKQSESVSRRDFVVAGATAAAAVSAVTQVGCSSLSKKTVAAAGATTRPAGAPLRIGFIGVGKMGWSHLTKFVGYREFVVTAVSDVDTTRREHGVNHVNEKYEEFERKGVQPCKDYKNYRDLIADKDIDCVLIATPDHSHVKIAMEACKAKKDIYCEKPLTLTIEEAKRLIEAVRKHERVFQVGSQQRTEGPFADAVDMIRAGRLGKIKEVHVGLGRPSKPCLLFPETPDPGLDWNEWLGQAQARPYNHTLCQKGLPDSYPFNPGWRDYREFSGGDITDWGAHHIDITHWALDMDKSGPVEVRPAERGMEIYGAKLIYRGSPYGVDEVVVTHKEVVYEKETKDKDGKPKKDEHRNGILFIGEKGQMFVNRGTLVTDPEDIGKAPLSESEKKVPRVDGKGMQNHHRNWYDCILSRERCIADVEVGARTVTAAHILNFAYRYDAKLKWDPQAWEFTGDFAKEANALRTRPRRKGYELPNV